MEEQKTLELTENSIKVLERRYLKKDDSGTKEHDKITEPKYVLLITGGPDKGKQADVEAPQAPQLEEGS